MNIITNIPQGVSTIYSFTAIKINTVHFSINKLPLEKKIVLLFQENPNSTSSSQTIMAALTT